MYPKVVNKHKKKQTRRQADENTDTDTDTILKPKINPKPYLQTRIIQSQTRLLPSLFHSETPHVKQP